LTTTFFTLNSIHCCKKVVAQTTLGGLTIYHRVANFLQYICAKNYENWLAVDKVIAKIISLLFLAHPVGYKTMALVLLKIALHIMSSHIARIWWEGEGVTKLSENNLRVTHKNVMKFMRII